MECFVMWSGGSEKILNDKIWHWVLIDTMIRLCFKHAASKVARVLCIWTLKPEQENAIGRTVSFNRINKLQKVPHK